MQNTKIKKVTTLKKNSSVVHISNKLTLLERKLFNILILNAYHNLLKQEKFKIEISLLSELLSYRSRNIAHLRAALNRLDSTKVSWNLLENNSQEEEWGATYFISGWIIKNGVCGI